MNRHPDFHSSFWLPGAHLQTVWGSLARPRRLIDYRRETLPTPDGDEILIDHVDVSGALGRCILLHGLEGSSYSVYIQGMASLLASQRISASVLNFRSCARDPRRLSFRIPNHRPRLYHSGETTDFDHLASTLASRQQEPLFAIGVSMGGNVLLKWLGEHPDQSLIRSAVAISTPYDLGAGAEFLERGLGPFYVGIFLRTLRLKAVSVAERFSLPPEKLNVEGARKARSFREFDDAATGPLHGFTGADDYYLRASSIRAIDRITTPALCISAEDDPFLPRRTLEEVRERKSDQVELVTTRFGGHTGFVGGLPWRCRYWAEETAVSWLSGFR
ncbi:MAG TPA: alpha/beta fold hydrolase [Thermoanaerobaculia bacterium]|nr:alpha/beta fold hydrolase [Thermoanaerobaculia bacterium]